MIPVYDFDQFENLLTSDLKKIILITTLFIGIYWYAS